MSIAVTCHKCQSTFPVKDKYAGKQGTCPVCKYVIHVPGEPGSSTSSTSSASWLDEPFDADTPASSSSAGAPAKPAPQQRPPEVDADSGETMLFGCPRCGQEISVQARLAGQKMYCGHCGQKVRIPDSREQTLDVIPRAVQPTPQQPSPQQLVPRQPTQQPRPQEQPRRSLRPRLLGPKPDEYGLSPARPTMQDDLWSESSSSRPTIVPPGPQSGYSPPAPNPRRRSLASTVSRPRQESGIPGWVKAVGSILATTLILCAGAGRIISRLSRQLGDSNEQSVFASNDDSRGGWGRRSSRSGSSPLSAPTGGAPPANSATPGATSTDAFALLAAYFMPGQNRNDLTQAQFVIDVKVRDRRPHDKVYVVLALGQTAVRMHVSNISAFGDYDRWQITLMGAPKYSGPITAWAESEVNHDSRNRQRSSNVITFQTVSTIPDFKPPAPMTTPAKTPSTPKPNNLTDSQPASDPWPTAPHGPSGAPRTPFGIDLPPDEQIEMALEDLNSGDRTRRRTAANLLQSMIPNEKRDEVARALEPLLDDPDMWTHRAAIDALAVWATAENTDALIRHLNKVHHFHIGSATTALALTGQQRAADALAGLLPTYPGPASQALRTMGSMAESPTLPYLKSTDFRVRRAACEVLQAVGGEASLRELRRLQSDSWSRDAASAAFLAIRARVDTAKREAEAAKQSPRESTKPNSPAEASDPAPGSSTGNSTDSSSDASQPPAIVPRALKPVR